MEFAIFIIIFLCLLLSAALYCVRAYWKRRYAGEIACHGHLVL